MRPGVEWGNVHCVEIFGSASALAYFEYGKEIPGEILNVFEKAGRSCGLNFWETRLVIDYHLTAVAKAQTEAGEDEIGQEGKE